MGSDISNWGLGRFLTLELLITLVIAGVAWGSLSKEVSIIKAQAQQSENRKEHELDEIRTEQKANSEKLAEISGDLKVIQQNQKRFQEALDKRDDKLDAILEELKR